MRAGWYIERMRSPTHRLALAIAFLGAASPQSLTPAQPFRISLSVSPFTELQFAAGIVECSTLPIVLP